MKVGVPVRTDGDDPLICPVFGKSNFFLFFSDGEIEIAAEKIISDKDAARYFVARGAHAVIVASIEKEPYVLLKSYGIAVYCAGPGKKTVSHLMQEFAAKRLEEITTENFDRICG